MVKPELRILGVDDGRFDKSKKEVLVVCTVYRGKHSLDGLFSFKVERDGLDSTRELIKAVSESKHKKQVSIVMIDGVALGGFNIIDLEKVNKALGIPVIAIVKRRPNLKSIKKALQNLSHSEKRWALIEKLPPVSEIKVKDGKVFYQHIGIEKEEAEKIIKSSILRGRTPEAVRAAHIIASGLN